MSIPPKKRHTGSVFHGFEIQVADPTSSAATESTKKVRSHYLRGHVESAVYHIAKLTDMAFDEEDYISRAGHELETFKKSYCRPMVERQKVAIMAHPRRGELTAEEIQFK